MYPVKNYFSHEVLEKATVVAADVDNGPTKPPIPPSVIVVKPDCTNFHLPYSESELPDVQCSSIIYKVGKSISRFAELEDFENVIDLKFNGKSYPVDTKLGKIHEEIDLSKPTHIAAEWGSVEVARSKLDKKPDKIGSWKIERSRELYFCSNSFPSRQDAEKFIKDFSESMAGINIELKAEVEKKKSSHPVYARSTYVAHLRIDSKHAKTIVYAEAAHKIRSVAPLIAQAMRCPETNSLGMLPLDVLCNLGPFLAPDLSEENAFEEMKNKIGESYVGFFKREKFLCIKPVQARGVRASIGATSCLLLDKSEVSRSQAERLENIAGIIFSSKGMELKFPSKKYAERFFHGLKNSGYLSVTYSEKNMRDEFGNYEAFVSIENLREVKRFVEVTCGYGSSWAKKLFTLSNDKIVLNKEFFIDELRCIGDCKNYSAAVKKEMARAVVDGFVAHLKSSEAAALQQEISKLAQPTDKGEPGPLQFLREHAGFKSILPSASHSDEAGTYQAVLAKIGEMVPGSS